jgi:NAD(P)-dependent dehydrogenase (short-subunit alcohol dehydrogenase family)
MTNLNGKIALVTGASGDIGRCIALTLGRAGAAVVVTGRDGERLKETAKLLTDEGLRAEAQPADIADEVSVKKIFNAARESFGGVDILVNNAGISPVGSVLDISLADWNRCLSTNLTGIFLTCREAILQMRERNGGAIVNIAGTLGLTAMPRKAAYCAAKAGVVNLTRQMALDFGADGIRVNAVCPGYIETRLNAGLSEAELRLFLQRLPIPSPGSVEDIAKATLYLSGAEARYITGTTLTVDGGQTAGLRD